MGPLRGLRITELVRRGVTSATACTTGPAPLAYRAYQVSVAEVAKSYHPYVLHLMEILASSAASTSASEWRLLPLPAVAAVGGVMILKPDFCGVERFSPHAQGAVVAAAVCRDQNTPGHGQDRFDCTDYLACSLKEEIPRAGLKSQVSSHPLWTSNCYGYHACDIPTSKPTSGYRGKSDSYMTVRSNGALNQMSTGTKVVACSPKEELQELLIKPWADAKAHTKDKFMEIQELLAKKNRDKLYKILLEKLLHDVKWLYEFVVETLQDILKGKLREVIKAWALSSITYLMARAMKSTANQLDEQEQKLEKLRANLDRDMKKYFEDLKQDFSNIVQISIDSAIVKIVEYAKKTLGKLEDKPEADLIEDLKSELSSMIQAAVEAAIIKIVIDTLQGKPKEGKD